MLARSWRGLLSTLSGMLRRRTPLDEAQHGAVRIRDHRELTPVAIRMRRHQQPATERLRSLRRARHVIDADVVEPAWMGVGMAHRQRINARARELLGGENQMLAVECGITRQVEHLVAEDVLIEGRIEIRISW